MKTSFSTVGCPDWSWNEIFAAAKDLGFDGIEIRGIGSELYAPKAQPFLPDYIGNTLSRLKSANMHIPVLATNACIGAGDTAAGVKEACAYVDLAEITDTPCIRVLVSSNPWPEETNLSLAADHMRTLCDYAAKKNVSVLIETNGILADSAKMKEFMQSVERENAGVVWDIHHPYRFFNESPDYTYRNIGKYVRHVHVKDSIQKDGKVCYRMMGYGDVPVFDSLALLKSGGYDGYVSLEWVKRWNPDLQEPGIVFAHFANYISYLLNQLKP